MFVVFSNSYSDNQYVFSALEWG